MNEIVEVAPSNEKGIKNQSQIAKDFIIIAFLIILAFISLVLWFAHKTYNQQSNNIIQTLQNQSKRIEDFFGESVDKTTYLMHYLSDQIRNSNADVKHITKLIAPDKMISSNLFDYTTFFRWADQTHHIIVNGEQGVLNNSIDVSNRDYLQAALKKPERLQFGRPALGVTTRVLSIPAAMGVLNDKGDYLGTLITRFPIKNLTQKLRNNINVPGVSFIILDSEMNVIINSNESLFNYEQINKVQHLLSIRKDFTPGKSGIMSRFSFLQPQEMFSYFIYLKSYPYIIVSLYDSSLSKSLITQAIIDFSIQCMVIAIMIIICLYIIRKLLVIPVVILSEVADSIADGEENIVIPPMSNMPYEILNLRQHLLRINKHNEQERIIKKDLYEAKLKLEQANQKIVFANEMLEERVAQRTLELENILKSKNNFILSVTSELRTPINIINYIANNLMEYWHVFNENKKTSLINELHQNSSKLITLFSNTLNSFNSSENKKDLNKESFSLQEVIDDSIKKVISKYDNKVQIILNKKDIANDVVSGDRSVIEKILEKLIAKFINYNDKNAILISIYNEKMTAQGGKIIDGICFSIINSANCETIKDLKDFYNPVLIGKRIIHDPTYLNLGLDYIEKVIDLHQGCYWYKNDNIADITFGFVLPCKKSVPLKHSAKNNSLSDFIILVIDDEQSSLNSIELMLNNFGFKVVTLESGSKGLDYLKNNPYNVKLILLDMMMPDMYGLNVLTEIKKDNLLKAIPIILLTESNDEAEINKALIMGAEAYLDKLSAKDILIGLVQRTLQS